MTPLENLLSALLAGLGAWINSVAGGGTFLTFPLLIFLGLGALQANIISTIALWPGSAASAVAYRHLWKRMLSELPAFIGVSIIGSALGAWLLLTMPERTFEMLVPWLLLFAALLLTFGGHLKLWLKPDRDAAKAHANGRLIMLFCQLLISIYGGYFGAGIGILMLAVLQFAPLKNIHEMNAVKVVLGTAINGVAFAMFALSGKVDWSIGIWMLAGGIAGGYIGTKLSLNISPSFMRCAVQAIAWVMTAAYFISY